ncbi:MAG: cytochrome b [Steroidobacteraceae bacterium]
MARGLHWLTVLLVLAEYIVGSTMPHIRLGTPFVFSIRVHLALGSGLVLVVLARIFWRLTHRPPPPPVLPTWQKRLADATHFMLYLTLILMPLAGWASASAHGFPVRAFGILPLPALVPYRARIGFRLGDIHADVLYWILLALIVLHIGAALYHRFVQRDSVLGRMLPGW